MPGERTHIVIHSPTLSLLTTCLLACLTYARDRVTADSPVRASPRWRSVSLFVIPPPGHRRRLAESTDPPAPPPPCAQDRPTPHNEERAAGSPPSTWSWSADRRMLASY
eukprot:GHVU01064624.1.p1 GENE.GHVU01064624.1~~GHVU01064624.1.p1  ORF type:complete len:109 (+),score=0.89 GHVU01064624.1:396-722(+)